MRRKLRTAATKGTLVARKPNIEIQTVTPGRAQQWLDRNTKNRKLSKKTVNQLVGEINRGDWVLTNDAITFDDDGNLLNGQHRLHACVQSGQSIEVLVAYGLASESQLAMDRGKKRSLADQLDMRGEANFVNLAGALVHLYRWEHNAPRHSTLRPSPKQGLELLDRHPNIRNSIAYGRAVNSSIRFNPSLGTFLHYTASLIEPEDADDFYGRLASGENLVRHHPIHTLRQTIEKDAIATKRLPKVTVHAYTIKAWNAYRNGEQLKVLRWRAGGAKPEPFPEAI